MKYRLAVNPIACTGHGICADMLPELIGIDEWGYPLLADRPIPRELASLAKRTVRLCPTLALRLDPVSTERKAPTSAQPAAPTGRPAASPAVRPASPAARPTSHRAGSR